MSWNYDELAATLRSQIASHPPVVVLENEQKEKGIGNPRSIGSGCHFSG